MIIRSCFLICFTSFRSPLVDILRRTCRFVSGSDATNTTWPSMSRRLLLPFAERKRHCPSTRGVGTPMLPAGIVHRAEAHAVSTGPATAGESGEAAARVRILQVGHAAWPVML